MNYWLVKSEADCYSIDHFKKDKTTSWTGIRNYQARNFMRDSMKIGDGVLFYHSNAKPTGVYGIAKVISAPHPDLTQFDNKDDHYDPKATIEKPIWMCVDIEFVKKFAEPVSLTEMKLDPHLEGMMVLAVGSRLSVQPVSKQHFEYITQTLAR
jgi:predicted RNA-binding protein with PUA-like domain